MSWTPVYTFKNVVGADAFTLNEEYSISDIDLLSMVSKTDINIYNSTGTVVRITNFYEMASMLITHYALNKIDSYVKIDGDIGVNSSGKIYQATLNVNLMRGSNKKLKVTQINGSTGYGAKLLHENTAASGVYTTTYTLFYNLGDAPVYQSNDVYFSHSDTIDANNGLNNYNTLPVITDSDLSKVIAPTSYFILFNLAPVKTSPGQPDDGDGKNSTEPNHGGDGDNTSDNTTILTPAFNGAGHFNRMYAISETQVKNVRNFLWNGSLFDITTFQKLFSNPMEAVIGLRYFPFDLQTHDASGLGASESMRIGNIDIGLSGLPVLSTYNQIFDLGTFDLNEYFGTAMDYEPYQKLAIYLPYIGIKPININNFMGSTIGIKYIIDIMTGECIATLWRNDQLLEHYEGKIGINISVSASNDAQYNAGLLMSVVSGGVAIAGALTANPMIATGGILSAAKSVASNQHHYTSGGLNSPNSSLYMPQYPYLIIQRPVQSLSSNFQLEEGYPLNAKETLSDLSGMTVCSNPILTGLTCTDEEKSEVYSILTSGVIL